MPKVTSKGRTPSTTKSKPIESEIGSERENNPEPTSAQKDSENKGKKPNYFYHLLILNGVLGFLVHTSYTVQLYMLNVYPLCQFFQNLFFLQAIYLSNQNARQARDREELREAENAWRADSARFNSASSRTSASGTSEFSPDDSSIASDPTRSGDNPLQPGPQSSQSQSRPLRRGDARSGAGAAPGSPASSPNPSILGDRLTVMGANENFRKWISWNELLAMLRSGEVPASYSESSIESISIPILYRVIVIVQYCSILC